MAKKTKSTGADGSRLVKRLREAQAQLRSHSTRAARAADQVERMIHAVEAHFRSTDSATPRRATVTRTTRPAGTSTAKASRPARRPRATTGRTGPQP